MSKFNYVRIIEKPTFEQISPIVHAAFHNAQFSQADFDNLANSNVLWLGAYGEDKLIGCAAITFPSPYKARLHKLSVLPEQRGSGLGRFLVCHAEREAFARGVRKMELVCAANDGQLVHFYSQQGYTLIKEKDHKSSAGRIAFMEKRMPHLIDQVGTGVHAFMLPEKAPEMIPVEAFEVALVYHPDEIDKPSNTGHVIQRYLPKHTREYIWHRHTIEAQVAQMHEAYDTVLLYPSETAVPLDAYCNDRGTTDKPLRLVVIDATWQQAQKIMLQSPALKALQNVKLVNLPASQYVLRKHQKPMGLCTLESVAEALSEIGYPEAKDHLMNGFADWMALGYDRYKG